MSGRARVALVTVAVLAVVGVSAVVVSSLLANATLGELVRFDALGGNDHRSAGAELSAGEQPRDVLPGLGGGERADLPPLADGTRRFAFVEVGCKQDSAQLVLQGGELDAQLLENGSPEDQTLCAVPVYFLTVFDVPVDDLPAQVRLP